MWVGRRALWWSESTQDEDSEDDGCPYELAGGQGLVEECPSRECRDEWAEESQDRRGGCW